MLEAKDQYFFDRYGRRYLDCVNNISHVGHSNYHVHNAMINQNLKLNTNTRYLYDIINQYSDKLLSKFPKKLNKIFLFVQDLKLMIWLIELLKHTQRQKMYL